MKARHERRILYLTMQKAFNANKPKYLPRWLWKWMLGRIITDNFLAHLKEEFDNEKNVPRGT